MSDSALGKQVGGDHYRAGSIQPVQYIEANHLGFLEGCVLKRVTRHARTGGKGRQDIEKAIHELQLLLELRYPADGGRTLDDCKRLYPFGDPCLFQPPQGHVPGSIKLTSGE